MEVNIYIFFHKTTRTIINQSNCEEYNGFSLFSQLKSHKKMKELTMQSDLSDFFLINKRIKLYMMGKRQTAEGDFTEFKISGN